MTTSSLIDTTAAASQSTQGPIWTGEIEVFAPRLSGIALPQDVGFVQARLLIRAAGTPIDFIDLELGSEGWLDLDDAVARAYRQLPRLTACVPPWRAGAGEGATPPEESPWSWLGGHTTSVSVVLCTRNRADGARTCIESLCRTRHSAVEIVVVDSASSDDQTRLMVEAIAEHDPRVRYVREDRPGLSRARNRGLAEATGEIVAFTDDDVIVDSLWLDGLLRGFGRRSDVACVTGIVVSASLRFPAERYFDARVWWSSRCTPGLWDRTSGPGDLTMHPYASGRFGTGANFAFRRTSITSLGGFDNSLGAGSLTQGGEDLDAFVRVLLAGFALSYEPTALVRHHHRVDNASLIQQMHGYGLGLGAYLTKYLLSSRTRREVLGRLFAAATHASGLVDRSISASDDPIMKRAVLRAELTGVVAGPWAYLRSRRRAGRAHARAVAP